jgi:hypothetical protein
MMGRKKNEEEEEKAGRNFAKFQTSLPYNGLYPNCHYFSKSKNAIYTFE